VQQGGAPSHIARNSIAFLRRENVACIEPDMCPMQQPGLKSGVHYVILGPYRDESTTAGSLKPLIIVEAADRAGVLH